MVDTTDEGEVVSPYGKHVRGCTGELKINRQDRGLRWNMPLDAGRVMVGDEVKISVTMEGIREA